MYLVSELDSNVHSVQQEVELQPGEKASKPETTVQDSVSTFLSVQREDIYISSHEACPSGKQT